MHHLGVGISHQFKNIILVVDHYKISVIEKKIGFTYLMTYIVGLTIVHWLIEVNGRIVFT